jgi:hypothetical protein
MFISFSPNPNYALSQLVQLIPRNIQKLKNMISGKINLLIGSSFYVEFKRAA